VQKIEVVYRQRMPVASAMAEAIVTSAADVVRLTGPLLLKEIVEVCLVVCLDCRRYVIGYHELSRGTLTSTLVEPRNVFQAALLANAAAVVLVHNHPSGHPTPSTEDRDTYRRLKAAGEVMGIHVHDFVILSSDGRHCSLYELDGEVVARYRAGAAPIESADRRHAEAS
jgi:DNA repair protein RadC